MATPSCTMVKDALNQSPETVALLSEALKKK